jgi:hypothetical protein
MPFMAVPRRLADRAVKGAVWAFIGAKRRPLTEQAGGLGAVSRREGQSEVDNSYVCQKPRSCRAQELARRRAQENAR